jgi:outer membrane protein assembly factor BamD
MKNIFWMLCLSFVLVGCASAPEKEKSEKEYFDQARAALKANNFKEATLNLEALQTHYPFGRYAEQTELDLIYSRYSNLDLEGAKSAADRFIRLHPQSEYVDYAYYMRGMADYTMDIGLAVQYIPAVNVNSRDPGEMRQAFQDFSELVTRFPNSQYSNDAAQRMVAIRNRLAAHEIDIAKYYLKRQAYIAAANRAEGVVAHYPKTPSVEPALMIMVETYRLLGVDDKAKDALKVLAANFPHSKAFNKNGKYVPQMIKNQNRSLLSVVTFGLFD